MTVVAADGSGVVPPSGGQERTCTKPLLHARTIEREPLRARPGRVREEQERRERRDACGPPLPPTTGAPLAPAAPRPLREVRVAPTVRETETPLEQKRPPLRTAARVAQRLLLRPRGPTGTPRRVALAQGVAAVAFGRAHRREIALRPLPCAAIPLGVKPPPYKFL